VEPSIWVSVRWSTSGHSCKRIRDAAVESTVELHHNRLQVLVPRVIDEVLGLVQILVNKAFALEVCRHLQGVDSSSLHIQGEECLAELFLKLVPVIEAEGTMLSLVFKLASCPATSTSALHVGHGPDDPGTIGTERLRGKTEVRAARHKKHLALRAITIEIGRDRGFDHGFAGF